MGKRPKRHIVEIVDHAITIGSDQGHISGDFFQALFERITIRSGFFKTGRVTHYAASPHLGQFFQRADGGCGRDGKKNSVRSFWQIVYAGKARQIAQMIAPQGA